RTLSTRCSREECMAAVAREAERRGHGAVQPAAAETASRSAGQVPLGREPLAEHWQQTWVELVASRSESGLEIGRYSRSELLVGFDARRDLVDLLSGARKLLSGPDPCVGRRRKQAQQFAQPLFVMF